MGAGGVGPRDGELSKWCRVSVWGEEKSPLDGWWCSLHNNVDVLNCPVPLNVVKTVNFVLYYFTTTKKKFIVFNTVPESVCTGTVSSIICMHLLSGPGRLLACVHEKETLCISLTSQQFRLTMDSYWPMAVRAD